MCLGENTENYITFSLEKKLDNGKASKHKLKLLKAHYQVLLIILMRDFIMINAQIASLGLTSC